MKIIFLKIYRVILILTVIGLLFWLLGKNMVIGGKLFLVKDFCSDSEFISNLYPEMRVGTIGKDENKDCWQKVFVEPVYFKIKIPRTFDKVKVKITYNNQAQEILRLGIMKTRTNPLDWRFILKTLEDGIDNKKNQKLNQNAWQEKELEFDIGADYINNGGLEFIISAPGLTESRYEIGIKRIEAELSRPSVNWSNFIIDIKNYILRKIINVENKIK
jgi:hypothetical protein